MSKSRVCPEEQKKENCVRKINLLVYEKQRGERCTTQPKTYVPPISSPHVKRIKVCTGAEMKRMCPPPPCPCPPTAPGLNFMQTLGKVLGFGAKSLLALGAVYVTYDMGIWGDSDTTRQLYQNMCRAMFSGFIKEAENKKPLSSACKAQMELFSVFGKPPDCCDKFPIDHESGVYELQQKWNKIVIVTFSTIAGFPSRVRDWSHKVYCKMFDSESCKALKIEEEEEEECCPCDE